jgi:hypothetical protein
MKTMKERLNYLRPVAWMILVFVSVQTAAQQQDNRQILDQNISIYAENEPLSNIIEKICTYLNIDYSYNSRLVADKKVSLNVSNKPIKYVLEQLMKDFYLIFELDNNILVVRDYVPLEESLEYQRNTDGFFPANRGFFFENPRNKQVTLDFKLASNLIILPVTINDSDTLNFILDTGVRYPLITELPYINKLELNYLMPVEIQGLGEGETLTAYRSGNNRMKIEGMVAHNQEVQMIINENFQISHILGLPVHGLIGFNLFKDYIVTINYLHKKITLYKPEYYKYRDRRKDIILPLHFEGNKPFVHTTIVTQDSTEVPVKLLVDTGASDALWLSENSDERIELPDVHIETFLGRGLNGDVFGKKGRLDGLWVGPLILPKPIVAFPNSELIDELMSTNDRNGTLGAEILRRFLVTLDYRNQRLTLRPTSDVKDDFNYNMSGMDVVNPLPGLPVFTIDNVRMNSPAYYAGLQENDQILSLNHISHRSLELNDINLLLQSRENRKIKIKVLRNGEELKTEFRLKRIF